MSLARRYQRLALSGSMAAGRARAEELARSRLTRREVDVREAERVEFDAWREQQNERRKAKGLPPMPGWRKA